MVEARENVRYCKECCTLTDKEVCPICSSPGRDHKTIMVVENTRALAAYEKTGKYDGNSVRPSRARSRVTSSIYSKSPPTGTPLAILLTLIPVGRFGSESLPYTRIIFVFFQPYADWDWESEFFLLGGLAAHILSQSFHQLFQLNISRADAEHWGDRAVEHMVDSIISDAESASSMSKLTSGMGGGIPGLF